MFGTFTFDRGLRFWSGLLVLKFAVAVGVFTWHGLIWYWYQLVLCLMFGFFIVQGASLSLVASNDSNASRLRRPLKCFVQDMQGHQFK